MLSQFLRELQHEPYFMPLAAILAVIVAARVFGQRRTF
jgi:hypothetical protein